MQLHALRFLIYTRSLRLNVWDVLRDPFIQNKGVISFKKIGLGETYCFIYVKTILVPFLWIAVVLLTSERRTQKQVSCWKVTFVVPVKISPYSTSKKLLKTSQFPHAQKTLFRCQLKKKPTQKTLLLSMFYYLQLLVLLRLDWDLLTGQFLMPVGTQKVCLCNYCFIIWIWGYEHWEEVLVSSVASPLVFNQHKAESSLIQM